MCDIKKVYRFKQYHVSVIMNICAATENSKLKIYIKKHFNIFKKQEQIWFTSHLPCFAAGQ